MFSLFCWCVFFPLCPYSKNFEWDQIIFFQVSKSSKYFVGTKVNNEQRNREEISSLWEWNYEYYVINLGPDVILWNSKTKTRTKEVEVYSLVSTSNRYSSDFTQLPPGHRTCSFISHLNFPGSIYSAQERLQRCRHIMLIILLASASGSGQITAQESWGQL